MDRAWARTHPGKKHTNIPSGIRVSSPRVSLEIIFAGETFLGKLLHRKGLSSSRVVKPSPRFVKFKKGSSLKQAGVLDGVLGPAYLSFSPTCELSVARTGATCPTTKTAARRTSTSGLCRINEERDLRSSDLD